jgi:hypothetical protein
VVTAHGSSDPACLQVAGRAFRMPTGARWLCALELR